MKKSNPFMEMIAKKKEAAAKKDMPMKKMAAGGKMPMKDGKPAFLNDGKGMKAGGKACAPKKMAAGGKAHSDMAKDKPMMKKVAKAEVKGHEKKMHGMAKGGGVEIKGKTKGTMVRMKKGGDC